MPIKMDFKQVGLLFTLALTISACSTVKQKETPEINAPTVLIQKADLEALQNSAKQWQTAQPKVEKLIQLEAKVSELTLSLEQIDDRNIRNAELPVNIEPIVVNNITLYRLKLGAYIKKAAAKNDCSILKKQKINCFVSYYTEQQPQ